MRKISYLNFLLQLEMELQEKIRESEILTWKNPMEDTMAEIP